MASPDLNMKMPMRNITRDITMNVTVTGVKTWKVRLMIGGWLIRLAALVMGIGVRIETEQR